MRSGLKYLCTRKLNQYPLENCFSFIRSKGGFSANPDPKQFADAYKQELIKSFISQSELSNCESDTNSILLEVFGTQSKQCANGMMSLPLMIPCVSLDLQRLTSIRYPNQMLCFMLEGIFARNILRNTVAKSVLRH